MRGKRFVVYLRNARSGVPDLSVQRADAALYLAEIGGRQMAEYVEAEPSKGCDRPRLAEAAAKCRLCGA